MQTGLFFDEPLVKRKDARLRPPPSIPETGWRPPTEFPNLSAAKIISFDTETKDLRLTDNGPGWARNDSHIVGISIAAEAHNSERGSWYFPIRHEIETHFNMDVSNVLGYADHVLNTPTRKVGANLTYDIGTLAAEGVRVGGMLDDVQFAEALIDNEAFVSLDHLAHKYLNSGKVTQVLYDWIREAYPNTPESNLRREIYRSPPSLVGAYAQGDAWQPLEIFKQQEIILRSEGLTQVYRLECDLIPLMVAMRMRGVPVDVEKAIRIRDELQGELPGLFQQIRDRWGFNLESTSSGNLGRFFDHVGIDVPRTDGGNYSVRKEWLAGLDHPAGEHVNLIREYEKMIGTFLGGYVIGQNINGRLHPQFHQLHSEGGGTKVGRFSCVADHTEIETDEGFKRIDAIEVGDYVRTHKNRFRPVTHTWVKGAEPMLNIKFSNGDILTCTISHKLLVCGDQWITVEEIANEYFKVLGLTAREYCESAGIVSQPGSDDSTRNSCASSDNVSQHITCYKREHASGGKESACSSSILSFKNGGEQSNDGEDWRSASKLDRRSGRLQGLLNDNAQRQAPICAPGENGASTMVSGTSSLFSCSPYRRESIEQRIRQFSLGDRDRTQDYTFPSSSRQQIVTIEEINFAGCFLVYDITVEEDESYAACGVYSHNSSNPNLQNIPSRTKLGKRIRECFVPEHGAFKWRKFDYSQIHYRLLAHFAVDKGDGSAEQLREEYRNNPKTDYHMNVYGKAAPMLGWSTTDEEEIKIKRRPIKNVNFGLLYGQSEKALAYKAGFSGEQAKEFFRIYHAAAPYVKATMEAIEAEMQQYGYITTLLGRRIRFNDWEPIRKDWENSELPLPYNAAIARWGAGIRRAYGYRAVNYRFQGSEPDLMKTGMLNCWKSGVFNVTGVPHITVHDELDFSVMEDTPLQREAYDFIQKTMQDAIKLRVPVFVDESNGESWGKSD